MTRKGVKAAVLIGAIWLGLPSHADGGPTMGRRYELTRPMYLMATYDSLNDRRISSQTAQAYLHASRYYDSAWVAFQVEVPAGTFMTIVGNLPKVWNLPFLATRYIVQIDPDVSRGLEVVLELDRGIEGDMDGLNPGLFRRKE